MTSERLTRCPHCQAAFKVSDSQLSIAGGRVRCGACMNVFDALAYTIGDTPSTSGSITSNPTQDESHSSHSDPVSSTPIESSTESPSESPIESQAQSATASEPSQSNDVALDDELFQDNPDEDSDDEQYSGSSDIGDELSASILSLDEHGEDRSHYQNELEEHEEADESWATEILEDERSETQQKLEPQISDPVSDDQDSAATEYHFSAQNTASDNEAINFYYEEEPIKQRPWFGSALLIVTNIILVVLLLALASWFHYEKLVKYPRIATLYTQACELLNCQLPELSDLSKIRSHSLIVRSHPTAEKALIIDAVMINDADYAQSFPNLALYFSDINNQTVAQRLIEPEHYLFPEILAWQKMPSQQPIHLSIEIVDPGKEAVNYSLKFFPAAKP